MVHLEINIRLRRQLSMKINMPKSSPTTQKCGRGNLTQKILNYLTSTQDTSGGTRYSTISHQPGTPWGHIMDICKWF